jgi:hypothetical protein
MTRSTFQINRTAEDLVPRTDGAESASRRRADRISRMLQLVTLLSFVCVLYGDLLCLFGASGDRKELEVQPFFRYGFQKKKKYTFT